MWNCAPRMASRGQSFFGPVIGKLEPIIWFAFHPPIHLTRLNWFKQPKQIIMAKNRINNRAKRQIKNPAMKSQEKVAIKNPAVNRKKNLLASNSWNKLWETFIFVSPKNCTQIFSLLHHSWWDNSIELYRTSVEALCTGEVTSSNSSLLPPYQSFFSPQKGKKII